MRETPLARATPIQVKSIKDIFEDANLSHPQQDALIRCLAGHTNLDELTQSQATIVLSSMVARGYSELASWADDLNRITRGNL
jgi:hypothetical protein